MKIASLLLVLCGAVTEVCAGEAAFTLRATDLKEKPFSDAPTVATVPARAALEILQRQASWTQVKAPDATGWVKMLSLQLAAGASEQRGDSGLGALFNLAQTGRANATVTTGVRGLSEEQLKNAQPDPRALALARQFAASRPAAERFAQDGHLQARQVNYFSGE